MVLQLLDDLLQPLLKVAAIAGPGQQGAHVQAVDGGVLQDVGHLAVDDLARQAFGDGGLADAGIADQQRVVLGAAAQDLDRALDLGLAADQRVDLALAGLLVEVDAIGFQRLAALFDDRAVLGLLGTGAAGRARFVGPGLLGDAVGDEVDRIIARHVLLLQEVGRVAFPLGEDGDQDVGAGHLFPARRLDMDHRALDHALEARRRLGVVAVGRGQGGEVVVDVGVQRRLQRAEVDVAGGHDRRGVGVVDQGQQQVLERGVFMPTLVGVVHRAVQGLFERTRKRGHGRFLSVLFHRALQGVLVTSRRLDHLGDLGFGHFIGEDAADPDAMLVHMQHDAGRVLAALLEEPLQHVDDEFHRRVVVVQDQHSIERGPLKLRLCLGGDGAPGGSALFTWPSVRHSWSVVAGRVDGSDRE
ncbi:hypothetical protein D3C77_270700 [compost metagenome]